MYKILENNLNNLDKNNSGNGKYLIQTCSQAKTSGIKLPEVHGAGKKFRSHLKTRETTYFSQTRKIRQAAYRSRKSKTKEEET